jgi:hypothetical protein
MRSCSGKPASAQLEGRHYTRLPDLSQEGMVTIVFDGLQMQRQTEGQQTEDLVDEPGLLRPYVPSSVVFLRMGGVRVDRQVLRFQSRLGCATFLHQRV